MSPQQQCYSSITVASPNRRYIYTKLLSFTCPGFSVQLHVATASSDERFSARLETDVARWRPAVPRGPDRRPPRAAVSTIVPLGTGGKKGTGRRYGKENTYTDIKNFKKERKENDYNIIINNNNDSNTLYRDKALPPCPTRSWVNVLCHVW